MRNRGCLVARRLGTIDSCSHDAWHFQKTHCGAIVVIKWKHLLGSRLKVRIVEHAGRKSSLIVKARVALVAPKRSILVFPAANGKRSRYLGGHWLRTRSRFNVGALGIIAVRARVEDRRVIRRHDHVAARGLELVVRSLL